MNNKKELKRLYGFALLTIFVISISLPLSHYADAQIIFRNTLTGEQLDFSFAKKGEETKQQKYFMSTGLNQYLGDAEAIKVGADLFLTACSGCHGHEAEGKLGPALGDDYWTYPKNTTDKGFFETMFGGARAMMGPQYKQLTIDEMLKVIAYVRSIYWGSVEKADWLTEEQKATFKPAHIPKDYLEALKKHQESS